jgi:hypothetical protein
VKSDLVSRQILTMVANSVPCLCFPYGTRNGGIVRAILAVITSDGWNVMGSEPCRQELRLGIARGMKVFDPVSRNPYPVHDMVDKQLRH